MIRRMRGEIIGAMKIILSAVLCLVSVGGQTLDVRDDSNKVIASYRILAGLPKHPTPTGDFTIGKIVWNPRREPGKKSLIKGVRIMFKEPDSYIGDPSSQGGIRMASKDSYALARLLMDRAGVKPSEAWYQDVIRGKRSVTVTLPKTIAIRISK